VFEGKGDMSSSGRLGKVKRALLRHETTDILREGILSNQFAPGDALVERELAAEMEVSRTAVREALIKLEAQGLVTSVPHKGWSVARLTPRDIWEIYTLRSLLEGFAARLVTERTAGENLAELDRIVGEMRTAVERGDRRTLSELDFAFHEQLCELSGHSRLLKLWYTQAWQFRRYMAVLNFEYPEIEAVAETHVPILQAIRSGDPDRAQATITRAIEEFGKEIAEIVRALQVEVMPGTDGED
jgi:DNA-binding GntR family transcriptional regulator